MGWMRAIVRPLLRPRSLGRALAAFAALAWCLFAAGLVVGRPGMLPASAHGAGSPLPAATSTPPSPTPTGSPPTTTPIPTGAATGTPQGTATKSATTPTATATAASTGGGNNGGSNGGGPVGPQPTRVNLGQPAVGSSDSGGGIAGFSPTQLTSNGLVIFTTLGCLLGVGGIAALAIGGISLVSDGWGPLLVVLLLGNRRGRRRFVRKPTDGGWGD